jgi:deoxyribonuclease-4
MIIGSHVGFKTDQLLGSVKEALSYEANTFMFYTGAPQNTLRKPIDSNYTKQAWDLMKANGIDINNVICHAPYIVNLANKEKNWDFSINFIRSELKRCDEMGITKMVLHPGNAVGMTKEEGISNIVEALNIIIDDNAKCKILLETMAGKGTECGCTLEEMESLIKGINNQSRIGVCLDTCHLHDSGININEFDLYLDNFDKKIGLNKIECVHINDSKNELASHKDRHENIGFGYIGFDSLLSVINNDKLKEVPKILETPYIEEKAPYKYEIAMIRNGVFNKNLQEEVINS